MAGVSKKKPTVEPPHISKHSPVIFLVQSKFMEMFLAKYQYFSIKREIQRVKSCLRIQRIFAFLNHDISHDQNNSCNHSPLPRPGCD